MNVLIIPEDFTKDQYIVTPIVKAMLAKLGRRTAKIGVCRDPRLGGIDQALNREQIERIINRYRGMIDLFLLLVDRDGKPGRREQLDRLEEHVRDVLDASVQTRFFLGENAWQEVEVWTLAGHDLPNEWSWAEIRSEPNPKERFFVPFARHRDIADGPGEGRKALSEEAARRYDRLRRLCPEDIGALHSRIQEMIESGSL